MPFLLFIFLFCLNRSWMLTLNSIILTCQHIFTILLITLTAIFTLSQVCSAILFTKKRLECLGRPLFFKVFYYILFIVIFKSHVQKIWTRLCFSSLIRSPIDWAKNRITHWNTCNSVNDSVSLRTIIWLHYSPLIFNLWIV